MTVDAPKAIRVGHPAPHRDRVGLAALVAGMTLGPAGWAVQLVLGVTLSGHACYPRDRLLAAPSWDGVGWELDAVTAAGIVMASAGLLVGWRNWRRTREERPGSMHNLLERGDGRTRFMALCGVLGSGLFLLALAFAAAAQALVPLCGR